MLILPYFHKASIGSWNQSKTIHPNNFENRQPTFCFCPLRTLREIRIRTQFSKEHGYAYSFKNSLCNWYAPKSKLLTKTLDSCTGARNKKGVGWGVTCDSVQESSHSPTCWASSLLACHLAPLTALPRVYPIHPHGSSLNSEEQRNWSHSLAGLPGRRSPGHGWWIWPIR